MNHQDYINKSVPASQRERAKEWLINECNGVASIATVAADYCRNNPFDSEKCECVTYENFTSFPPVNETTITPSLVLFPSGVSPSISVIPPHASGICTYGEGFTTTCKVWNYSSTINRTESFCVEAVPK